MNRHRTPIRRAARLGCAATLLAVSAVAGAAERARDSVALGRHLAQIAGCNDCHSPGYLQADGKTDEAPG